MSENPLDEKWVPAYTWEGVYEVSSWGRLRRVAPGKSTRPGKIVQGTVDKRGYTRTRISYRGREESWLIHRLIGYSFLGDPPKGKGYILHGDGNPGNNHISNLRWGDQQDNINDAVKHGTMRGANSKRNQVICKRGHPLSPENVRVDKKGRRNCRSCVAIRKKSYADKGLPDGDPRHGTPNAYLHWQCRCNLCRGSYSEYSKGRRRQ